MLQGGVNPQVIAAVRHHHERWDGRGYPGRLAGEDIPIEARLISVADAFDAMTSNRPYRVGMKPERAKEILLDGRRSQFDAVVVDAFLRSLPNSTAAVATWGVFGAIRSLLGDVALAAKAAGAAAIVPAATGVAVAGASFVGPIAPVRSHDMGEDRKRVSETRSEPATSSVVNIPPLGPPSPRSGHAGTNAARDGRHRPSARPDKRRKKNHKPESRAQGGQDGAVDNADNAQEPEPIEDPSNPPEPSQDSDQGSHDQGGSQEPAPGDGGSGGSAGSGSSGDDEDGGGTTGEAPSEPSDEATSEPSDESTEEASDPDAEPSDPGADDKDKDKGDEATGGNENSDGGGNENSDGGGKGDKDGGGG